MEFWLAISASAFISSIITTIVHFTRRTYGTLKIDTSNPEKDVYQICVDDLDLIRKKKRIELKIERDANLSQR